MFSITRYLVCFTLVAVFLLHAFGKTMILLNFELNRSYIEKNLCEKREDPTNQCKGSCFLSKDLQNEEKQQQAPASPVQEKNSIVLYSQFCTLFTFSFQSGLVQHTIAYTDYVSGEHFHSVFHPPRI